MKGTPSLASARMRRVVEVVVVVVRDHHRVERRQRLDRHRHGLEALRPAKRHRRGALAPHRIGEHAHAVDLEQHRRVAEPGGAQAALGARRQASRDRARAAARRAACRGDRGENPRIAGIATAPRWSSGKMGWMFRNLPPWKRADACIRSRRTAAARSLADTLMKLPCSLAETIHVDNMSPYCQPRSK